MIYVTMTEKLDTSGSEVTGSLQISFLNTFIHLCKRYLVLSLVKVVKTMKNREDTEKSRTDADKITPTSISNMICLRILAYNLNLLLKREAGIKF